MNALPQITPSSARLPETYERARVALAACQDLDECKDWSDKAAALASYAKQAEDDTLLRMATRIKARATRRAGELLQQIQPQSGARTDLRSAPAQGRGEVAREAGLSERQQKTALRIASVPAADFERQVESDTPPTLSQLAQQGIKPRPVLDLKGRDPREFNRALHFLGTFENYARELDKIDIAESIACLTDRERETLRGFINQIDATHDRIMTRI